MRVWANGHVCFNFPDAPLLEWNGKYIIMMNKSLLTADTKCVSTLVSS